MNVGGGGGSTSFISYLKFGNRIMNEYSAIMSHMLYGFSAINTIINSYSSTIEYFHNRNGDSHKTTSLVDRHIGCTARPGLDEGIPEII